jgi:transposase-like protein
MACAAMRAAVERWRELHRLGRPAGCYRLARNFGVSPSGLQEALARAGDARQAPVVAPARGLAEEAAALYSRLHDEGAPRSIADVAKEHGISRKAVLRAVRARGETRRMRTGPKPAVTDRHTEAVEAYLAGGVTLKQVAAAHGIARSTLGLAVRQRRAG